MSNCKRWSSVYGCALAMLFFTACHTAAIDLGPLDSENPPSDREWMKQAQTDAQGVGVVATVEGETPASRSPEREIFVLVTPLSNVKTRGTFWVQRKTVEADGRFFVKTQFGERDQGAGEYFGIVALEAKSGSLAVGQRAQGLPKAARYSKFVVVRRRD